MNEKIKQLQNTAGIHVARTLMRGDENTEVKLILTQTQLDRFAELIVRECVKVCADRGTHHDGLYSAWADDCSKRIGKHFGVE